MCSSKDFVCLLLSLSLFSAIVNDGISIYAEKTKKCVHVSRRKINFITRWCITPIHINIPVHPHMDVCRFYVILVFANYCCCRFECAATFFAYDKLFFHAEIELWKLEYIIVIYHLSRLKLKGSPSSSRPPTRRICLFERRSIKRAGVVYET